ncbi:efflux transporter outer membrane subunit [Achromobacter sp. F4_2707]|uniref:efflux transporter outer membrane subunit n=1 Tax=Achromobacter sp. F4_2707 TaxID=3114286 RepID=UPI0039C6FB88
MLALAGCAVGPDYQQPAVDVGASYGQANQPLDPAANSGWVQVEPGADVLRPDWWVLYGDDALNSLMQSLQSQNLDIQLAEARYRQAQAALQSARSSFFPTVGSNASAERTGSGSAGNGVNNNYALSGSVSWELDLWGRVRRSVESSQAGLDASVADIGDVRLSMQSTLAQTYFSIRVADAEIRLMEQTVQAYERSLQLTENRYNAGVATPVDVAAARTQLENARTQLLALQRQRAQLEHAVAVLLGQPPAAFELAAGGDIPQLPTIPVGIPAELLQRRPDVAAAERRMAEANAKIGVAQAAWFPALTLGAQGGFRSGQWAEWLTAPARYWALGPALALTLFDGGARSAAVEQARADFDIQALSWRQTVLAALQEVEDLLVQLRVMGMEQVTQGRALESARESLRLTQNQYEAGLIDYLSVVQTETTALSTERSALNLLQERLNASARLMAALGGGWTPEAPQNQNQPEADAASD